MMLNENDLRLLIRNILQEQEEVEEEQEQEETDITVTDEKSFNNLPITTKAKMLIAALKARNINVRDTPSKATTKEIRLVLLDKHKTELPKNEHLKSEVELAFQRFLADDDITASILPPLTGRNEGGTYNAISIDGQPLIVFGGSAKDGKRAGGLEYEREISKKFKDDKIIAKVIGDNTKSDIKIHGTTIELKKIDADAGGTALVYDFTSKEFYPKSLKKINVDVAVMINSTFNKADTERKFNIVKSAIGSDENTLQLVSRESYYEKVKPALYDAAKKASATAQATADESGLEADVLKAKALSKEENLNMATAIIKSEDIANYYRLKGARFIQVQTKGLYHLNDADKVIFSNGQETLPFKFDGSVAGKVTFQSWHGDYALRPRITGGPYKKLAPSGITLDNSEDRKLFADWAEKQNLNESAQNRWQLLSGIK